VVDPTGLITFDPSNRNLGINMNDPAASGTYQIRYKITNPNDPNNYAEQIFDVNIVNCKSLTFTASAT